MCVVTSVALTDLALIRQATLLNQFTTALTRGGPSGLPRPIELHAHDPIRYVGDMLAWVHQAMATEREFLDSLFGLQNERRMVGSSWKRDVKEGEQETEEAAWVRELMDRNLEKLCAPLKVCFGSHCIFRKAKANITRYFWTRSECNRPLSHRKGVLRRTRSRISSASIC